MGISAFSGVNLALTALQAQQRALDVAGHNVANVDRAGYTRQDVVLAAAPPLTAAPLVLGQGVQVQELRRMRDEFLDLQARTSELALGRDKATAEKLGQVEDLSAEPGDDGLAALLGKFWTSWQDLADHPESASAKAAVAGAATNLATAFNRLDAAWATVGAQAGQEAAALQAPGGPVDRAARELAALDPAIVDALAAGQQPNDLLDRRDQLLDELSALGQVSVTDLGGGSIEVAFGDAAAPLVSGSTMSWPQTLTAPGGRIGALLTASTATIPAYRADLDAVASALASSVNGLHPTPVFSGATAASLTAVATAATIDASAAPEAGANDAARALAALRGGTADTLYASLVTRVGTDAATARAGEATAQAVRDQLADRRAQVAGVSLDEEMANMLRFQRAYQAASRVLTTMDEALDVLINRTGRVGL
jgi:flagellar hook-associated protein 1 FlgK